MFWEIYFLSCQGPKEKSDTDVFTVLREVSFT